jgi:hypothetical protein
MIDDQRAFANPFYTRRFENKRLQVGYSSAAYEVIIQEFLMKLDPDQAGVTCLLPMTPIVYDSPLARVMFLYSSSTQRTTAPGKDLRIPGSDCLHASSKGRDFNQVA